MCRCCQSCLESLYWNCCEEPFCYDESIAKYSEDLEDHCYDNHNGSFNNLAPVTRQPTNNNHLNLDSHREILLDVPILAPDIYKVFSKSMIFKDDDEVKKYNENEEKIEKKPKSNTNKHLGKAVSFEIDKNEDEKAEEDVKMSDFEIMFQDELFKIDEEEEGSIKSDLDDGLMMKSRLDVDDKIATPDNIIDNKPNLKSENVGSIARVSSFKNLTKNTGLSKNDSFKSFSRSNSKQDLLKRVDSMVIENKNLKNVLSKLPQKSASFLSIQDLIQAQDTKNNKIFTISSSQNDLRDCEHQISKLPDTPVIISGNLPKFFAETPVIEEYKMEKSLKSLKTPSFTESDYSMPRHYGRAKTIANFNMNSSSDNSKSMPDLRIGDKQSKRLTKLRSKLKPLIINHH